MRAALLILATATAFAQSPPQTCTAISPAAAKSEFDAASVKPAGPFDPATAFTHGPVGALTGGPRTNDPGRITSARVALSWLIMTAFGLERDQVKAPDWAGDMIGSGFALSAAMPTTTTQEEYCGMLRNLLVSRFHLTFHIEKQPRPGYELTVLAGGPKFKPYDPNAPAPEPVAGKQVDANGFPIFPPSQPRGHSSAFNPMGAGLTKIMFRDNVAAFVGSLGNLIDRSNGVSDDGLSIPRVIDKTGLEGVYDIRLEFAGIPINLTRPRDPNSPAPDPVDAGPNIFTAVQQQLGLKLTKVKDVPVEVLIVDHADQTPTGN